MLRQLWKLQRDFLSGIGQVLKHSIKENRKGLLISLGIVFLVLVALLTVVLEITASPEFCGSCHNMSTYIESWRESTHKNVSCTDCHFEPGLKGTLIGKWKAQSHIVMKITGMAPSRPHTQISDASCLRTGCHSTEVLSKTKTIFKGVDFEHGAHLNDQRRGKKLRCVTCHSQIVQGEHLTITESTCFTCHFYGGDRTAKLADCKICHKQTREKLFIDANENMPFVHKEYVDRGVLCSQCHFDIISGDGHLKDNICVQCHSEPSILGSKANSEEIHQSHVADHKVECYRCHSTINHGLVRIESPDLTNVVGRSGTASTTSMSSFVGKPLDANCVKCHTFDQHKTIRLMYMGKGAAEINDVPSPMYEAHADCGSCHIALHKTETGEQATVRMQYDEVIKSCAECHGEGYDVMAKRWKEVLTPEIAKAQAALTSARATTGIKGLGKQKTDAVAALLDTAEKNLAFVRKGRGLHNIDYALKILGDCQQRAEKAKALVLPGYAAKKIEIPNGCAQLCHSCVECVQNKPVAFGSVKFPHDVHVSDEGLKCLDCHSPREQHGQTLMINCNKCHHGSGNGAVTCQDCHVSTNNLYNGQNACDEASCDVKGTKNPMVSEVKCAECHAQVAKNKPQTLDGVKQTCIDCHDKSYGPMVDDWKKQADALKVAELNQLLKSTQEQVLRTIRAGQYTYDAQDLLNKAEKNIKVVTEGNPIHNLAFSKDLLTRANELIQKARKNLQIHSTIKTIEGETDKK